MGVTPVFFVSDSHYWQLAPLAGSDFTPTQQLEVSTRQET